MIFFIKYKIIIKSKQECGDYVKADKGANYVDWRSYRRLYNCEC